IHTFQLRAVAYVNTRRANTHALVAINTVPRGTNLILFKLSPILAAHMVISHNDGIPVQQYALHTPIGAYYGTHLLPEPGINQEENRRKNKQRDKPTQVFTHRL